MEAVVAVYDACVLYSAFLRDFLVRFAVQGERQSLLRAKWTGRIHREWMAALRRDRPGIPLSGLHRMRRLMDRHVRACRVYGYQRWEKRLTLPDPDDRHVLAAALACVADVIVTFNIRDFPEDTLTPFSIAVNEPDQFVMSFAATDLIVATAADHRASLRRPALTDTEYLEALRRNHLQATADRLALTGRVS